MKKYQLALMRLFPNGGWSVNDDDYTKIIFKDSSITSPTIEELEAEVAKMEEEENQRKSDKASLLNRLGITEEEAQLLLS